MKKIKIYKFIGILLLTLSAAVVLPNVDVQAKSIKSGDKPHLRTLNVLAKSSLEGTLVPYVKGVPHTGQVDLHYSGTGLGFVDGDQATLIIKIPDEFKYVMIQDEIKRAISGEIRTPNGSAKISSDNLQVFADRIAITSPHSFFVGVGTYEGDIVIDYGKVIDAYPNIPIADAPSGYKFSSTLGFASAPWDIIEDPIFGTFSGDWTTPDTQAIVK